VTNSIKTVEWSALHRQFGAAYGEQRQFRRRFVEPLSTALGVYPEARITVSDKGLLLSPSRTPPESKIFGVPSIEHQGELGL
jgi:hypothetical protein